MAFQKMILHKIAIEITTIYKMLIEKVTIDKMIIGNLIVNIMACCEPINIYQFVIDCIKIRKPQLKDSSHYCQHLILPPSWESCNVIVGLFTKLLMNFL